MEAKTKTRTERMGLKHDAHSDASSKPQIVDLHFLAQGRKKRAVCLWARRYSIRSSSPWMRPDVETIAGRKA